MVENDIAYVRELIAAGLVRGPCLEAGAGLDGHNLQALLKSQGIEWFGTDLRVNGDHLYAVDLGDPFDTVDQTFKGQRFETVLLLNVIEHVFEPVVVLDNARRLVRPGGHLVVIVPTVWPLHYYPLDCWRIPPNFFEEYARRRGLTLLDPYLRYVTPDNLPVPRDTDGNATLPPIAGGVFRQWRSRAVHRAFRTTGRGVTTPTHVSTGAVLRCP
jgi:SAM-dependent methyltransferase